VGGYELSCELSVEGCGAGFFFEHATRNLQLFKLACFSGLRFCSHQLKTGRGTRDEGRNELGGRGSCRAETAASSEWRIASSFSGGQCSRTAENFRHIRRCALQHYRKFFRRIRRCALQNFSPNEFGAQKNSSSTTFHTATGRFEHSHSCMAWAAL
jgi:hypothetical protein